MKKICFRLTGLAILAYLPCYGSSACCSCKIGDVLNVAETLVIFQFISSKECDLQGKR